MLELPRTIECVLASPACPNGLGAVDSPLEKLAPNFGKMLIMIFSLLLSIPPPAFSCSLELSTSASDSSLIANPLNLDPEFILGNKLSNILPFSFSKILLCLNSNTSSEVFSLPCSSESVLPTLMISSTFFLLFEF